MAGYSVRVPHAMGRRAALAAVQEFLEVVRRNHAADISDVRGQWTEHSLVFAFAARGLAVQGTLAVEEDAVLVSGPLPLAALFFRGRIEQTIRQELEKILT